MNIKKQILILIFVLHCCNCELGLFLFPFIDPFSTAFYQCLTTKGYKKIVKNTSPYPDKFDSFFTQWMKAKNIGLDMDLIYSPCRSRNSFDQVTQLLKYMPGGFDGTLWIQINLYDGAGDLSECSWVADYGYEKNCAKLNSYLKQFKSRGVKVGILSWAQNWLTKFGKICNEAGAQKLMWLSFDQTQSYDSFRSFGGWIKPSMKLLQTSPLECGKYFQLIYFQQLD